MIRVFTLNLSGTTAADASKRPSIDCLEAVQRLPRKNSANYDGLVLCLILRSPQYLKNSRNSILMSVELEISKDYAPKIHSDFFGESRPFRFGV